VKSELSAIDGSPELTYEGQPSRTVAVGCGVVHLVRGVRLFGDVHCHVRTLHQVGGVSSVIGVDTDSDTCRDSKDQTFEFKRLVERAVDAFGHFGDDIATGDVGDQDRKLVTTEPCNGVVAPQDSLQSPCELLQ
jgi:hypothetical protein